MQLDKQHASILMIEKTLTAAQIKTLHSSPTEIVAAIPGRTLIPILCTSTVNPGNVQFVAPEGGGDDAVCIGWDPANFQNTLNVCAGELYAASPASGFNMALNASGSVPVVGGALKVGKTAGDPTAGNGTLTVKLAYIVV